MEVKFQIYRHQAEVGSRFTQTKKKKEKKQDETSAVETFMEETKKKEKDTRQLRFLENLHENLPNFATSLRDQLFKFVVSSNVH